MRTCVEQCPDGMAGSAQWQSERPRVAHCGKYVIEEVSARSSFGSSPIGRFFPADSGKAVLAELARPSVRSGPNRMHD